MIANQRRPAEMAKMQLEQEIQRQRRRIRRNSDAISKFVQAVLHVDNVYLIWIFLFYFILFLFFSIVAIE